MPACSSYPEFMFCRNVINNQYKRHSRSHELLKEIRCGAVHVTCMKFSIRFFFQTIVFTTSDGCTGWPANSAFPKTVGQRNKTPDLVELPRGISDVTVQSPFSYTQLWWPMRLVRWCFLCMADYAVVAWRKDLTKGSTDDDDQNVRGLFNVLTVCLTHYFDYVGAEEYFKP